MEMPSFGEVYLFQINLLFVCLCGTLSEVRFDWDNDKNALLKKERSLSFEVIADEIDQRNAWKIVNHPNRSEYPNQKIAYVVIDKYVVCVPFEDRGDVRHLITVYKSRKITDAYRQEKESKS